MADRPQRLSCVEVFYQNFGFLHPSIKVKQFLYPIAISDVLVIVVITHLSLLFAWMSNNRLQILDATNVISKSVHFCHFAAKYWSVSFNTMDYPCSHMAWKFSFYFTFTNVICDGVNQRFSRRRDCQCFRHLLLVYDFNFLNHIRWSYPNEECNLFNVDAFQYVGSCPPNLLDEQLVV